MQKEVYIIIGVILTGIISFTTAMIVQKLQSKRELYKLAFDMAKEEYQAMINKYGQIQGFVVHPLESFVAYHLRFLKTINKSGFKISDLDEVQAYRDSLNTYYEELLKKK